MNVSIHSWLQDCSSSISLLDARVLLAESIGLDNSADLSLADPNQLLKESQLASANRYLSLRKKGVPISQILGYKEFFGRDFKVTKDTLAPRPESEAIVERAIEIIHKEDIKSVSDIGTGSGCLILSVVTKADENVQFIGCDNSDRALQVARENAINLSCENVDLVNADIYQGSPALDRCMAADLIMANLPYVPDDYPINQDARFDPKSALFSGPDGLDHYRQLFRLLSSENAEMQKTILIEHLPKQYDAIDKIASGFKSVRISSFASEFSRI